MLRPGAALLALCLAAAAVAAAPAAAQTATLAATAVGRTTATLRIDNHSDAWYYRRTAPDTGLCSSRQAPGTDTVSLSRLTAGTEYTYAAYSDAACSTELASASFTTVDLVLSADRLIVAEGKTASYTVRLAAAPTASVTLTLAVSGDTSITISEPATKTLTFTRSDWDSPQSVTIAAADDIDKAYGTATVTHTATSTDTHYRGVTARLTVTEGDDDVCARTAAVGGSTVDSGGLVDDCGILLAAKDTLRGSASLNWSTSRAISLWTGLTVTNSRVTAVDLDRRNLTGRIPSTLGGLDKLTRLALDYNSLSGWIPAELGNLGELTELYLNNNSLSGSIPAKLGDLSKAKDIRLNNNNLTGTIPAELGIAGLTSIILNSNRLSGCIPASLSGFGSFIETQQNNRTLAVCKLLASKPRIRMVEDDSSSNPTTYTLKLASAPTADVTVAVTVSGDSDITVAPSSLTFTSTTYSTAQTITVTGSADSDAADDTATITHTATSTDSVYNNVTSRLDVFVTDDDAGLSVSKVSSTTATLTIEGHAGAWYYKYSVPATPAGTCSWPDRTGTASLTGLTPGTSYTFKAYSDNTCATELTTDGSDADFKTARLTVSTMSLDVAEGGTGSYSLRLAAVPLGNVTVNLAVTGDPDVTVDPTVMVFTTSNWNIAKRVVVSAAVDADAADGEAVISHIATGGGHSSSDAPAKVVVTEEDDDSSGLVLSPSSITVEEGSSAVYTVRLEKPPSATVTVTLSRSGDADLTVSPVVLTFAGSDFDTPRTVTVRAAEDPDSANGSATIVHRASGAEYNNVTAQVTVTEEDNDPGWAEVTPRTLNVGEGLSAEYTIRLNNVPTTQVTIATSASGDSSISVTPSVLTFTTSNYRTAQTVTVHAAPDADSVAGNATIRHSATGGNYNGVAIPSVSVTEVERNIAFVDVADSVFNGDIHKIARAGITRGCAIDRFCPNLPVTRGEMAAFLVRGFGLLRPASGLPWGFDDIEDSVFRDEIRVVAALNITRGCGDGRDFCPDQPVTRGQMAAFLSRALGLPRPPAGTGFDDTSDHAFRYEIAAVRLKGITKGCAVDRFCPDQPVTRGEMAAFLVRALNL